MELQSLGIGAGAPAEHRNVTNIASKLLDERNGVRLFDCGESTRMQILRTAIRPRKIGKVFITHLHGDYIFGLPELISSRSFQGGDTPLEIYGPKGIGEYMKVSLDVPQTRLGYPLKFIELDETGPTFTDQQFSVYAKKLNHGIDSFGYHVVGRDHRGESQVDRLKELGVPAGPLCGRLKQGGTIQLEDGRTINGKDFVGPGKKGRVVTILGDTRKTHNSVVFAKSSDILVHESTFNKDEARMAHNYFHSTIHQAAEVVRGVQVKRLLSIHIGARYLGKTALEFEKGAGEVLENITIMKDFDNIGISFRGEDEA